MTNVLREFEDLESAYSKKTLSLLKSDHSRFYLSMFKVIFPEKNQPRAATEVWLDIESCFRDFIDAGYGDRLPIFEGEIKSGQAVCQYLIEQYRWVESRVLDSGVTEYQLTPEALEAMAIIESLSSTETLMSASRMKMIVDAIEDVSIMLSPDRKKNLALLKRRADEAQKRLREYEKGHGGEVLAEDARHAVINLISLMRELPRDLAQLQLDVRASSRELRREFSNDTRPIGEIIGDYLKRSDDLLTDTANGRCFLDAMKAIGNVRQRDVISAQIRSISSSDLLKQGDWGQQRRLGAEWKQILDGTGQVLTEQGQSTEIVKQHVKRFDSGYNKELASVLKELDKVTERWASSVGKDDPPPFTLDLYKWDKEDPHWRLDDLTDPDPPKRIVKNEVGDMSGDFLEFTRFSGPRTKDLIAAMKENLVYAGDLVDLRKTFNSLPEHYRRPCELTGIFQLFASSNINLGAETPERGIWACVASDGTQSFWRGPTALTTKESFDLAAAAIL